MKQYYLLTLLLTTLCLQAIAQPASDYAIQVSAVTTVSPPQIKLLWKKVPGATGYTLFKKAKQATSWSNLVTLTATDSIYVDNAVVVDSAYEYQVAGSANTIPTGFIYASIRNPSFHIKGGLVLLVDSVFTDSCSAEIKQLMNDLSGDGWQLFPHVVGRSMSVPQVKALVTADYQANTGMRAVLLLGHIPVPYSGELNPDGHPDHLGAWPADVYYGDVDGNWTDVTVNNSSASRPENKNIPGDGKFDQTVIPSAVELEVSRIDFANMPAFSKTEITMMRSYLNKAHNYKLDMLDVIHRGLVDDNFGGFSGEAFAANAWRNFTPLVGRDSTKEIDFITNLNVASYQWAYGCGSGSYTGAGGIGSTQDFTTNQVNAIFCMSFGSYFGDWDATNSFLRAPLCADVPALTNAWAGRPNWFLHHMALGENIGYATRLTQNNGPYNPPNYGANFVHTALMGDLSLRTDYIKPVSGVTVTQLPNGGATISWTASPDAGVEGYYVYRSNTLYGKYTPVSGLLTTTSYDNLTGASGMKYYQVRPVKLQTTPSGRYYNSGIGMIDSAVVNFVEVNEIVANSSQLSIYPNPAVSVLQVSIYAPQASGTVFSILDVTGKEIWRKEETLHTGINSLSIPVAQFSNGVYTLQLKQGAKAMVEKWVKE